MIQDRGMYATLVWSLHPNEQIEQGIWEELVRVHSVLLPPIAAIICAIKDSAQYVHNGRKCMPHRSTSQTRAEQL